jgi:hypothetical protein
MQKMDNINWSLILGVFAGIIAIGAAMAQWNEKKNEERKALISEQKADTAQKELKAIQLENLKKTNDLAEAYKQIARLQNEIKNEITGGNSTPLLKLTTTKIITDEKSRKNYFIIFFDMQNEGKYPLQNLKCTIYDNWGLEMLKHGVKHFRDGLSFGFNPNTQDDVKNYRPANHFDIGTVTVGKAYPLYTTTFSPQLPNHNPFSYTVEIQWYSGSLVYFINLTTENENVTIESVELLLNGKHVTNYQKFLVFNNSAK